MEEVKGYTKLKRGRGKGRPLYEQIRSHLVEQIKSGQLNPGDKLPAVSRMARNWKVDYQTVSSALEKMQSDGLIKWQPGKGKGTMVINHTGRKFCMTFIRWNNEEFDLGITEGVRKFAEEKGLEFSVTDVSRSEADLLNAISHPAKGTHGIIIIPQDSTKFRKACIYAQQLGMKIVFADRNLEGLPISSVSDDHVGGAHQATKHLLEKWGLPVYCLGVTSVSSVQDRFQGWATAMRRYGFTEHSKYIREIPDVDMRRQDYLEMEAQHDYESALALLKERKNAKTSVFTCTGSAAQGLYKAARELGFEIGSDIYVAGFGDDPISSKLSVPLTCVPQNFEELGHEAASVLFMEMSGASKHPMYRLLPAKLRIRRSSIGNHKNRTSVYDQDKQDVG